jgi:tRNA-2-methylthio-N6-dimethylallyladenosine synthase
MLKKMNREMKISDYTNLIKYIRKNVKDCVVSTDLIVGFPNETEKEFKETLKLYKKIKYDNAYTFIYSKKEGTYAATIDDKLTLETKKERLQQLNELVQYYSKLNNEKFVGKILKVLVEGESKNNESMQSGYSEQ